MLVKSDLTSKDTSLWSSGTDFYRFDSVNEIVSVWIGKLVSKRPT